METATYYQPTIDSTPGTSPVPTAFEKAFANEARTESLFEYYNVDYEVSFIRNNKELPHEQKSYYLRENVSTFLAEFAGKSPFKRITYIQRGDNLYYGDIPALAGFKKTAGMEGATDRERAEAEGFEGIEKALAKPDAVKGKPADAVCWISPPKIADYGFVFYFVRDVAYDAQLEGYKVFEYILRYPEKMTDMQRSNQIAYGLGEDVYRATPEDFLHQPIAIHTQIKDEALRNMLKLVDIGDEEIRRSTLFDSVVQEQLGPDIDRYVDTVFRLSQLDTNDMSYNLYKLGAMNLLSNLFKRAKAVREIILTPQNYITRKTTQEQFAHTIAKLSEKQTDQVVGGGSCPVVNEESGNKGFLSATDIYDVLKGGKTLEQLLQSDEKESSFCPQCQKDGGDGHYHCMDKKCDHYAQYKYSDETKLRPEQRTKACRGTKTDGEGKKVPCNFQFGC
jgi:hypothetical protein